MLAPCREGPVDSYDAGVFLWHSVSGRAVFAKGRSPKDVVYAITHRKLLDSVCFGFDDCLARLWKSWKPSIVEISGDFE